MPRIDRMIANIKKFGVFAPNKYLIEFSGILGIADLALGNRLSLMCTSMTLPGRSIATTPDRNSSGPQREIPYEPLYSGEVNLSFYLAKDLWERRIFETWQDTIVDPITGRLGYYKDYTCDMFMYVLNEFDMPIYRIRLEEVFPKAVSEVEFTNQGGNEVAQQTMTLSFRRYVPTIVNFGLAVAEEFLYDIDAVREFDDSAGSLINDVGILGGKYGNPFNYSQVIERFADAGAVVNKKVTKVNLGNFSNWFS
tara:strand:- start:39291 stop:40046 length:756 start_codon:yes stop_codon:yes gene_type:complete